MDGEAMSAMQEETMAMKKGRILELNATLVVQTT